MQPCIGGFPICHHLGSRILNFVFSFFKTNWKDPEIKIQKTIMPKYSLCNLDLGARNRKEEALMTRQLHRIVQQSKDCGEKDSEQCVSTFGII